MHKDDDNSYPPLVSPRSPSYERAWRELQHSASTASTGSAETIALLARLCEAEQNATQVSAKAVQVLGESRFGDLARDLADLHHARRSALVRLIESLGGSAPTAQESREILTYALDAVARAQSLGAAREALKVMRRDLVAEYEAALQSKHLDASQRAALRGLTPDGVC